MTIELVMTDMLGDSNAVKVLDHCVSVMPQGFFSRSTLFAPSIPEQDKNRIRFVEAEFPKATKRYLYNIWKLRELVRWIDADFYMCVQYDGYIINPNLWTDDFVKYDFIGAPWNVTTPCGNSGFCLQSKRFGIWVSNNPDPMPTSYNNDTYVAEVLYKKAEKEHGFKCAPIELAAKFSLECNVPEFPRTIKDVFGFHGKHHLTHD